MTSLLAAPQQQKDPLRVELWQWINTLRSRKMKLDTVISMDHLIPKEPPLFIFLKCCFCKMTPINLLRRPPASVLSPQISLMSIFMASQMEMSNIKI